MLPRILRAVILAAAFLAATTSSNAVSVSPVKLELMPGQKATQLNILNPTDSPRVYDVRVQSWDGVDQESGRSITSNLKTKPVLLSLPVVSLMPHATATIRIAVSERSANAADYYRIFIDDITPIEATTSTTETGATANVANLRMSVSLPFEVRNKKGIVGELTVMSDGLGLTNRGANIVAILGAKKSDGKLDSSVFRYMFPGEKWTTTLRPDDLSWLAGLQ